MLILIILKACRVPLLLLLRLLLHQSSWDERGMGTRVGNWGEREMQLGWEGAVGRGLVPTGSCSIRSFNLVRQASRMWPITHVLCWGVVSGKAQPNSAGTAITSVARGRIGGGKVAVVQHVVFTCFHMQNFPRKCASGRGKVVDRWGMVASGGAGEVCAATCLRVRRHAV